MENVTLKTFPSSEHEFLASLWIRQQDLSDKSPIEISDMYYKALSEIKEKYAPKSSPQSRGRRPRSHGIKI